MALMQNDANHIVMHSLQALRGDAGHRSVLCQSARLRDQRVSEDQLCGCIPIQWSDARP